MIWGVDTAPSEFVNWSTDDKSKIKKLVVIALYTRDFSQYNSLKQYKKTKRKDKLDSVRQIEETIKKYPIFVRGFVTSLENYVRLGVDSINERGQSNDNFEVIPKKGKSSSKALVKSRLKKIAQRSSVRKRSLNCRVLENFNGFNLDYSKGSGKTEQIDCNL